jgi:thymidylate synthase (FAD)
VKFETLEAIVENMHGAKPETTEKFSAGAVSLLSAWGNEATVINTARVSTGKEGLDEGKGEQALSPKDKKLLRKLWMAGHTSPFETIGLRFLIIMPILVARQFMRHRIGWSFCERSLRYNAAISDIYVSDEEQQVVTKGGFGITALSKLLQQDLADLYASAVVLGKRQEFDLKRRARVRECIRNITPVGGYTRVMATCNWTSLQHFFKLRLHSAAQKETRDLAIKMHLLAQGQYPLLSEIADEKRTVEQEFWASQLEKRGV